MSRLSRGARRRMGRGRHESSSAHEHARLRAAERLARPLEPAEAAWLQDHLAGCDACRSIAAAYDADRLALRDLRETTPQPPRDLWARTSAAIERDAATHRHGKRGTASGRTRTLPALGALSGLAVVVVVVGVSVISGGFLGRSPITALGQLPGTQASVGPGSSLSVPRPTPIAVGAGNVDWLGIDGEGNLAFSTTGVHQVCAQDQRPDCAPLFDPNARRLSIDARPKSIFRSPVENQAVVVGTDATGHDAVFVISLPTVDPTPGVGATPPTASPATQPYRTPAATTSALPTLTPPPAPTASASAGPSDPSTPEPTLPIPTSSDRAVSPEPTVATAVAIVSGIRIVGQSAAYSPDGAWFAFTARPSDDSVGPDIYVWRVGDALARPLTTDHASIFASWAGEQMLGSRPVAFVGASVDPSVGASFDPSVGASFDPSAEPSADPTVEVQSTSFFIDPESGLETPLAGVGWRPVIDPTGRWVVAWEGTVRREVDRLTTVPATGALILRRFQPIGGSYPTDVASPDVASPDMASPTDLAYPTAVPSPVVASPVVADGGFREYDVRWDQSGSWLAVWLADMTDPAIGRLSLLHLDPATGTLDQPPGAPRDVAALPGFSIADGRIAWATPPGQGGEGSRIQIVAWAADAVGGVESVPIEGVVVVH